MARRHACHPLTNLTRRSKFLVTSSFGTMAINNNKKGSKKAVKAKKDKAKFTKATRDLKSRHLAAVCAEINSRRGSNGRIPRGEMAKVFQEYKPIYSWLTIDIIKKGLNKSKLDPSIISIYNDTAVISDLTDTTTGTSAADISSFPPPASIGFVSNSNTSDPSENTTKKIGRPKGTTVKASRERMERIEDMTNSIVMEWKEKVDQKTGRMPNKALDLLIEEKKQQYNLNDVTISKSLVRQRIQKNRLVCNKHSGTLTPIAPVEKYLVAIIQSMSRLRQPLNVSQGLALANSLVQGTEWEQIILDFKKKRGWKETASDGEKNQVLGQAWYRGFWKRNKHLLERKKGQKFARERSEWSVYRNFVQMYDEVYEAMVYAGVAIELAEPVWVNEKQEETDEQGKFGQKATHLLVRPDYVIFVDECGCNTSQEGDGAVGGERKIVIRGTVPKESASTNSTHFTLLGFTAATGEPVMCAVIIAAKTLRPEVITGLDIFAPKEGNEMDPEFYVRNTGPGKMYPCGPTCTYRGKEVPCLVCNTENGSITSDLLKLFLEKMDKLDLFPRNEHGTKPFLLLDGHGSRLELPFLQYINTPIHEWVVCIGVPYGTSYWQVGDSAEQNGSYKMALTKSKRNLVLKKQRSCMNNPRIDTHEIMVVVNDAWNNSFARVEYNQKAIAARGWNPLTRNLLDHPEIAITKETSPDEGSNNQGHSTASVAATLNFSNGLAHTCISDIIQNIDLAAVREHIRANQDEGRDALEKLTEAKKLSAGTVFKSGRVYLGPEVLQVQLERKRIRDEKEKEAMVRREDNLNKKKAREQREQEVRQRRANDNEKKRKEYEKIMNEVGHLNPSSWTKAQLKVLVSYKKQKTDDWRLPTTVAGLLEKWEIIKDRLAPAGEETLQPPQQQEQVNGDDDDDEDFMEEEDENNAIEEV